MDNENIIVGNSSAAQSGARVKGRHNVLASRGTVFFSLVSIAIALVLDFTYEWKTSTATGAAWKFFGPQMLNNVLIVVLLGLLFFRGRISVVISAGIFVYYLLTYVI